MNFSVLDWNIQGKKYYTRTSLKKIKPVLEESEADIFCLQEGREVVDKIKDFAELQKFNYVFSHEDVDGTNIIISRFPIVSSGTIIPPSFLNKLSGKALWADLKINGRILKIYNCHFGIIGLGPRERAAALKYILADAGKYSMPTIICGDLNTTIPAAGFKRKIVQWFHEEINESMETGGDNPHHDERHYLLDLIRQEKFREVTDSSKSTWVISPLNWEIFSLKLDWFMVRNLETTNVVLGKYISDHRSIFAQCTIN